PETVVALMHLPSALVRTQYPLLNTRNSVLNAHHSLLLAILLLRFLGHHGSLGRHLADIRTDVRVDVADRPRESTEEKLLEESILPNLFKVAHGCVENPAFAV